MRLRFMCAFNMKIILSSYRSTYAHTFQNSRALKTAFLEPPLLLLPHLDDTLSGTQDAGLVHGAGCDDINASLCP